MIQKALYAVSGQGCFSFLELCLCTHYIVCRENGDLRKVLEQVRPIPSLFHDSPKRPNI